MAPLHNRKYLKPVRKYLRNNSTSTEATLWNILKNKQSEHNKVEFRVDDVTLENEFATILNSANFIINPIHTPMGNQGKISKRREYFSTNNKIYISTNNIEVELGKSVEKLLQRKLQYVLKNSVSMEPFSTKIDVDNCFISNQYLLDE